MMIQKTVFIMVLVTFSSFWAGGCGAERERPSEETPATISGGEYMKVSFYTIDREGMSKGEYVGFAELEGNSLNVEVSEPELANVLKSTYTTLVGEEEDGKHITKSIGLEPGTPEHLEVIASESYTFGYISVKE